MEIINYIFSVLLLGMLIFPSVVVASEEYDLTITMPISSSGSNVELKQVTFVTFYSQLETRVGAVTWDPCKAKNQSADCNIVNPLNAANLSVSLYAYNATDVEHLEGCYVAIDLTRYQPLPDKVRAVLGTQNEKAELLQLAVESIQRNTRNSPYYVDCELRVMGIEQHSELTALDLPKYLNPVIPQCRAYTQAGRVQAKAINDEGMVHYRAKDWQQAAKSFRRAAELDCSYYIARTNLASVLSLQKQFEKAQAVLWRAVKLDPELTLKKLENDPDYQLLKQYANFYSASSQIGQLYRYYCFKPAEPAEIDSKLPAHIANSSLKNHAKSYSVATRYVFVSDFNKNGVADRVYPLIINHLHTVLVVFDGDKLEPDGCTSTPLFRYDLAGISRDDPCKIKLFAGAQAGKRGIRLETDHIGITRLVCR